jgi:hypothetical protein
MDVPIPLVTSLGTTILADATVGGFPRKSTFCSPLWGLGENAAAAAEEHER